MTTRPRHPNELGEPRARSPQWCTVSTARAASKDASAKGAASARPCTTGARPAGRWRIISLEARRQHEKIDRLVGARAARLQDAACCAERGADGASDAGIWLSLRGVAGPDGVVDGAHDEKLRLPGRRLACIPGDPPSYHWRYERRGDGTFAFRTVRDGRCPPCSSCRPVPRVDQPRPEEFMPLIATRIAPSSWVVAVPSPLLIPRLHGGHPHPPRGRQRRGTRRWTGGPTSTWRMRMPPWRRGDEQRRRHRDDP